MFINDRMASGKPAFGTRETWGRTKLGNRVIVGTNATILPVTICDDVMIGAGSVVTTDITKPGIYAGNPAKFRRSIEAEKTDLRDSVTNYNQPFEPAEDEAPPQVPSS